jgi:hypothetical protein
MIDGMNKLKANFVQAMRRLVSGCARGRGDRDAASRPADAETAPRRPRHPLFGVNKGLLRVMPGTDLTQPADPDWGKE